MNRDSFYFIIVLVMLITMFWNILPGYAASARATVTVTIISSVVVEPKVAKSYCRAFTPWSK